MTTRAPALGTGLALLRLLAEATEPLPAATLALRLGQPRSSVYHLLSVLVDEGFVLHYPGERRFGLGVAAFEVGTAYLRQDRLERLGRPVLVRLVRVTRATAHLGILLGQDLLYLAKEVPTRPLALVTEVGVRLPAHLTASGRSLLAALDPVEVAAIFPPSAPLAHRGAAGPRTVGGLMRLLDEERSAGVSVEDGHVGIGFASVAAVARDRSGRPVASVGVTIASAELAGRQPELAAAVVRAARALSRPLGG